MLDIPVRVKDALRDGRLLKEYEILILDDEGAIEDTIDNDHLIYESVHIDEKLCSGDVLKFGLCEGSSIEFEYFGKPDILGRRIHVFLHVQYKNNQGELAWYHNISMGFFTVEKCPRQFSTGIYKATAYNKLQSKYLDEKANLSISELVSDNADPNKISVNTVNELLLADYGIRYDPVGEVSFDMLDKESGSDDRYHIPPFKLVGSNTTYYPSLVQSGEGTDGHYGIVNEIYIKEDSPYVNKTRIKLNIPNAKRLIKDRVAQLKNWILENVQDGQTYWDNLGTYSSSDPDAPYVPERAMQISVSFANGGADYTDPAVFHFYDSIASPDCRDIDTLEYLQDLYFDDTGYITSTIYISIFNKLVLYTNRARTQGYTEVMHLSGSLKGAGDSFFYRPMTDIDKILIDRNMQTDVTLRDLQSATYEMLCQFGQLDRWTDLFKGIELNNSALFPADTLYPAGNLYPDGILERTVKSGYSKLWSEIGNVQSWRNLIITYKGRENNQEVEKTLTRTINANGTTDYNMSDNWLFKNLVWSDRDIGDYADAMVSKMQDVTWFPFEMWGAGLPYLETGDQIEVVDMAGETHPSYVLSRQLDGIQNLQDTLMNGTLDIF